MNARSSCIQAVHSFLLQLHAHPVRCSSTYTADCVVQWQLHSGRHVVQTKGSCNLAVGWVQGLDKLTRLIFARAQPKRLGNQIISGNMLASLAEAYVQAINQGAVPTIATAWQVPPSLLCPPPSLWACDTWHALLG